MDLLDPWLVGYDLLDVRSTIQCMLFGGPPPPPMPADYPDKLGRFYTQFERHCRVCCAKRDDVILHMSCVCAGSRNFAGYPYRFDSLEIHYCSLCRRRRKIPPLLEMYNHKCEKCIWRLYGRETTDEERLAAYLRSQQAEVKSKPSGCFPWRSFR